MPQIAQLAATYASQVFWMLIVFAVIYFGIAKGMLGKVESTIGARDTQIAGDLAAAEAARASADATEEAYRTRMDAARTDAQARTAEAKADATRDAGVRLKAADAELSIRAAAADARLAEARHGALREVEAVAAETASEIVARLSGADVAPDRARAAVRNALAVGN